MLAVAAFILFVVAAILRLTHQHASVVVWLLIIGGLLVSAAVAWGWGEPWWKNRNRTVPPA